MDNTTEEKNTQPCTPDEACNNPAAKQTPVTKKELHAAIDHLLDLVDRYKGRAVVASFVEGSDKTRRVFSATDDVFTSTDMNTRVYGWTGICGYLTKANDCLENNAKAIGEGVRLFIEQQQKRERMKGRTNPVAAMFGIAGCGREECED